MVLEMKIPSPGESITEVEISQWLVKEGDIVNKDQTIAELDSDKATLDLPAEASGKISFKAQEGDTMSVGDVICLIDPSEISNSESFTNDPSEKINIQEEKVETTQIDEINITPLARNIATDKGIDIKAIESKGEKITKEDVLKAAPAMGFSNDKERKENREKLSMLRRKVAERLVSVKNETAMLTTFNEADLSKIFELRKKYKEAFSLKHGVGLGFMSFFTKAVTRALQLFPDVNSMINGNEKISYNYSDVSIAVSGPKGLMTPVLRNAQNLSFAGIEQEIKRLADHVRNKSITVDELTGGTFTISNGGVFGSMLSTPIINPPQSGILGMHNIIERPIAIDGKVEIRPMMYLALSYDHRIIDGNQSVGFLIAVKEGVEDPENILMDGKVQKSLGLN
ncbi:MAG: dihydrolipoyllysine-residue succinyltransferase [Flavobacteriales bacterium]|nr:MAG: dihydrolipoyllysine-residue succinyltransferase [Flavobacteriales bacterium]CAI8358946.1 MAG: Dihydrolipoyllysine-residue succinyltransferase component of 2-oxoglutarate dehydrogenase complex [Flavobacteriales bacterium]|tara:strand:- start:5640 stop:6830 length:1191 start_codon:yes stop_codon:yes gene_type:complete